MRVFFNAIIIQLFLTAYVFIRGWQLLPNNKAIRTAYLSVFMFELLIYFIGFFGSHVLPFQVLHDFAWIGTSWMILIIYTGILLLTYDCVHFINKRKKIVPKRIDLDSLKIKRLYFCCTFILVIIVMTWGNYRFRHPVVNEMSITIDKVSPNVKNLKIVVVADIHIGFLIDRERLSKYVDQINEQKPDLILIAGDIIDYDIRSVKEESMEEELKRLKATYGVFASTGNHEYIQLEDEAKNEKITWLRDKSGLTLLQDTAVLVANSFYVVGREDQKCETRKSLKNVTANLNKDYPIIVMNHEPHDLQNDVDGGADLAVYGHTHNGQVFPNNILVNFLYEVSYGYKKKENTHIYVTSGLGLAGPQYRIGTVSEIAVINVTMR